MRPRTVDRLRTLLGKVRDTTVRLVTHEVWFYNLDNYRPDRQIARELRAIAAARPAIIAVCEVIGNTLPDLDGYRLIADTSTRSRSNIACYVRRTGLPRPRRVRWIDLTETWSRTEGPGTHEPRSYVTFWLGWWHVVVAHQPPKGTDNVTRSQQEGIDALVHELAPWTRRGWSKRPRLARRVQRLLPRLLVMDGNRKSGEPGPGPDMLAARIGGTVHLGDRIDHAVTVGSIEVTHAAKVGRVDGTPLQSDHAGAIRLRVDIARPWLRRV